MRVRQYVYFALRSERVSAVQIAREIGLEPDEVKVQGSRLPDVPIPRTHAWQVSCRDTTLFLHEQISRVLDRLEPYADRIGGLAARLDADGPDGPGITACLQIVREYTPAAAGEDPSEPNLLGWWLDRRALAFLTRTGTVVDVDEYHF
ncbi:DUF4279 domain-containing protein [Dactylosporangium sp. NPDC000555]|uniref:DUF4279 domain-containing protein n=1 Tax=Dactylosporangium sp. NPDC000555 TaxID=3154260 RepID=UPI00332A8F11